MPSGNSVKPVAIHHPGAGTLRRTAEGKTMAAEESWSPAPENTLESLHHAINMFDGIEFDVRITADNQLIIHHDRTVSVPPSHLQGKPKWLEEWTHDELVDLGFSVLRLFSTTRPFSACGEMKGEWVALRSNGPIQKPKRAEDFLEKAPQPAHCKRHAACRTGPRCT